MALETLVHFRNTDSTENINARLAGLIPKGIVKGGLVVPEPASLQVRIKGDGLSPYILLAFASDGMVIRERSEEHVLEVSAGITSVIALRAKYVESLGGTISRFEVISLGLYQSDPDPASLIRLCSVTPPAGATAVLTEHINMGDRDSIEGFTRRIVRDVVGTKEDLPAVSGFPAMAEVNFLGNEFALGTQIVIGASGNLVSFPIVSPINFKVATPSVPGLSRVNPSQKSILAVTQSLTGLVTVVTSTAHGFIPTQQVRISGCSAPQANQLWTLIAPPTTLTFTADPGTEVCTSNAHGYATGLKVRVASNTALPGGLSASTDYYLIVVNSNTFQFSDTLAHAQAGTDPIDITSVGVGLHSIIPQADTTFFFMASLTVPWSGSGGVVVDTTTDATVVARTATGVTHSFSSGDQFTLTGTTDMTFEGLFFVDTVIDAQTIVYNQSGYPTTDSGNGIMSKQGVILPANAIEIGESATGTSLNFETVFNASLLASDIKATSIGSSNQFMASVSGVVGNSYTISKTEPGVLPENMMIVLSGSTFAGGVDPNPTTANVDLKAGDLYVVLYGESGTLEIWGYDGIIFRNLTSATTATMLDFHRRNQFLNEKHVTENEKAALLGSVGVPSGTNRYLTQADTSTITLDIANALTGADNTAPTADNRYLTEARKRGERGEVIIPSGQDWVEVPLGEGIYPFSSSNVNTVLNKITLGSHSLVDGDSGVFITTGTLPAGLLPGTLYYVVNASPTTIQVSLTSGGAALPLGDGGSGSHSFGSGESWQLVVGADNLATDSSYSIPYFNIVFSKSLYDPTDKTDRGGPTEYSQTDFTPVVVDKVYVAKISDDIPPFPPSPIGAFAELNPSLVVDSSGIFPRSDALSLSKPTRLFVKFNLMPNNGDASLLYSKVVTERHRHPAADMHVMPQRILPAQVQDLINRTKELRFNAGIGVSGTTLTFPASLFMASNVQEFVLKRVVGSKPTIFDAGFSVNLETGTVTGDVDTFTPVSFSGGTLGLWTRYILRLTPQGRIKLQHISLLMEKSTDLAYAPSLGSVSTPSMPFADGSYVFASIGVKSDGVAGTTILDLAADSLELYPYQGSNEKEYAAPIICGDGVSSFGHFSGSDAHIRALAWAEDSSKIMLGAGTYAGSLIVTKDDITLDGCSGAIITAVSSSALVVTGKRFIAKNIAFDNCDVAIDLQGGADHAYLIGMIYESGVGVKIKAPSIYDFGPSDVAVNPINTITLGAHSLIDGAAGEFTGGVLPSGLTLGITYYVVNATATTIQIATVPDGSPLLLGDGGTGTHYFGNGKILQLEAKNKFNEWYVSDGSNTRGVGDFNNVLGIQQAHDVAASGDIIYILPGSYSPVAVTKDRLQFMGIGGGAVRIDGNSSICITVAGNYNQFDNFTLENAATGIQCLLDSTFNVFSPTVVFSSSVKTAIRMPQTDTIKHYNYHPLVSKSAVNNLYHNSSTFYQQNAEVSVGDGSTSWGDYVGKDAIQVAINNESEGTRIVVRPGTYNAFTLNRNNFVITGAGAASIIEAVAAPTPTACITIVNAPPSSGSGGGNKISGFYLRALGNERLSPNPDSNNSLNSIGVSITGDDNYLEDIKCEKDGTDRIEPHKKYLVTSGYRNRFVPHTGAPTGYFSWVVGDGVHSFGDFNGASGITQAIGALPTEPSGTTGSISDSTPTPEGGTAIFADSSLRFALSDIHRYLCVQGGINAGSFRIISVDTIAGAYCEIERVDGGVFTNEAGTVFWRFFAGSKIWVLPGQYDVFNIPNFSNDIDIEAWGAGHDTLIVGSNTESPLVLLDGNRCRIKGFRFAGGVPTTGVAVQVNGTNNVFESNRYETGVRFAFGPDAFGNQIYDAPEAVDRTYYTVSTIPSRGDFVGSSEEVIQAALDAAMFDGHINKVILGNGTWTLTSTIYVPEGITLEGSGYLTELLGDGLFPALTLDASPPTGGHQTITGIRFNTFSNSLIGSPSAGVFAYGNWLEAAPIDVVSVTGSITLNI
jgi:hypothetical protein